jgi:glycosyltransferase involved in cell wall biosynthesis
VPTVISSDGTPKNYDTYADGLEHPVYSARVEAMKQVWTRSALGAARHLLAFSTWVKNSYINDYGADPARVTVIPPGIDTERWVPRPELRKNDGKIRILFTGGNFPRKGGPTLLKWAQTSKHRKDIEVHLVTQNEVPSTENVVVHNNMRANTPELIELAQSCDIFALPTLGDCFSFAGIEASCTGMPVVISNVGGISEIVVEGETGFLVPRRDEAALFERLDLLVEDAELRQRMGAAGRKRSAELFNASRNASRVYDLLMSVAEAR